MSTLSPIRLSIAGLLLLFSTTGWAQKLNIRIKDQLATVNDSAYCMLEETAPLSFTWNVKNLQGREIIFARFIHFTSYQHPMADKDGRVTYVEITFLSSGKKMEIGGGWIINGKGLVKFIYKNHLIVNGAVDEQAADLVVLKYGTQFSGFLRQNPTIIINNN